MVTDKRIGVLYGGMSAERDVSLKSGRAIYGALESLGYDVVGIDVGPDICSVLTRERVQIAFLALHGGYGENGAIQGLLEVVGIPYSGSGVLASALAMNKVFSKKIFQHHHIPTPLSVVFPEGREAPDVGKIGFPLPWVVKPASEGSSIGVSIVRQFDELQGALERASRFGSQILVERYVEGKEVHIGVLNGKAIGGVEVKPSREFYTYEAKYTSGLTEYIIPPVIPEDVYERACAVALAAHESLGCKGATRVDLRIDGSGNPYVLEVNTIPGMTETSLLPKIARFAGLEFPQLIEEILRGAIDEEK